MEVDKIVAIIDGDGMVHRAEWKRSFKDSKIKIDEIMKEVGEQAPSIKKASGGIARMLGE